MMGRMDEISGRDDAASTPLEPGPGSEEAELDSSPAPQAGRRGLAPLMAGVALIGGLAAIVVAVVGFLGSDRSGDGAVAPTTTSTVVVDEGVRVFDDSGVLSAVVPVSWLDTSGSPWQTDGEQIGVAITASTDATAWREGWGTPGMFLGVTDAFTSEDLRSDFSSACAASAVEEWSAGPFEGEIVMWEGCGDEGSDFAEATGSSAAGAAVVLQFVIVDPSDRKALTTLATTLRYEP